MNKSRLMELYEKPLIKAFISFAIFRAFYGFVILIISYFIAEKSSIYISIGFLLVSMITSRIIFKNIKKYF
ncbi:MAG: hypothetical protein NLN64_03710 [Candidatus Thalassarchaeaceae archaeon]|nr:hypothetical protein [Candidatus Thalassarchaeaceae archaeon]